MKKQSILLLLITLLIIPVFNSCKKGEGDPFLSLRTRKQRITGKWEATKWIESSSGSYVNQSWTGDHYDVVENMTLNITNNIKITAFRNVTDPNGFGWADDLNQTATGGITITFDENGKFERVLEFWDGSSTEITTFAWGGQNSYNSTFEGYHKSKGTWEFLDKGEGYKNKERILLTFTYEKYYYNTGGNTYESSINYTSETVQEIWELNTLKNKEILFDGIIETRGSFKQTESRGGFYPTITDGEQTGTISGTLKQKGAIDKIKDEL